jgi:hypothetical protein
LLNLEPNLEVNSCWVGQKSVSTLQVKNRGGHAGFWILPIDSKDNAIDFKPENFKSPGTAKIGLFSIYPDNFFLSKGSQIELRIQFDPDTEGVFTEKFILGCDNLNTYEFSIKAESNMIELRPMTICGAELTSQCLPFKQLDFRDVQYKNPAEKIFEIENLTKNKISYEWRVSDKEGEFCINPAQGLFNEREIKPFTTTYYANKLFASYAQIELYIKDIPLESVRNPPPHIVDQIKQLEELPENERKKKKIEFVYFTFRLFGEVTPLEYSVSPTFCRAPLALPINHKNEARFTIRNYSKSEGRFSLKQDSISNENLLSLIKGVYRSNLIPDKPEQPDSSPVRYV